MWYVHLMDQWIHNVEPQTVLPCSYIEYTHVGYECFSVGGLNPHIILYSGVDSTQRSCCLCYTSRNMLSIYTLLSAVRLVCPKYASKS
jgi:hypothetical protein